MEADPEQTEKIECGLIFRSIGYFGVPVEGGIPYDHQKGIVPNIDGFVEPGKDLCRYGRNTQICQLQGRGDSKPP